MFPLPISTWIMIGLASMAMAGFGYGRYWHNEYYEFKTAVEVEGKKQEVRNEGIVKQQKLVNGAIEDEYKAKLAAVHNYYSSGSVGMQHPGSSSSAMPSISNPAGKPNEAASYPVLAEQCAGTTLQVNSLQKWILQQVDIK
jgi:hypothetical protein